MRTPALDVMRGIAVLLVMAFHWGWGFPGGGSVGVMLFFVLSGYLITSILRDELDRTGRVDLLRFYRRRAVRLFPALALMLGFVAVLAVAWKVDLWASIATVYLANFLPPDEPLVHTWSLAIEEQFYLAWPLLLLAKIPAWPAIGLVGLGNELWDVAGYGALAAGCVIARRTVPASLGWTGLGGLLVLSWIPTYGHAHPLVLVAIVVCACCAVAGGRNMRLSWRPMQYVGRISYGLYLWHLPLAWVVSPVLAAPLSFLVAAASWRYLERPLLARKLRDLERFHHRHDGKDARMSNRQRGPGVLFDHELNVVGRHKVNHG